MINRILSRVAGACAAALLLTACGEFPPMDVKQQGYRGTGRAEIDYPKVLAKLGAENVPPPPPYELVITPGSPTAGAFYQNIQVLGDLSAEEFNHLMQSLTVWVVPEEIRNDPTSGGGCNYCHNPANLASDEVYTKVVARRMLQMTRDININWKTHVGATGVTCYTCHRGVAVPAQVWATASGETEATGSIMGVRRGQNAPTAAIGLTSMPADPFTPYLLEARNIRVQSDDSLAGDGNLSIKTTERTYGFMMHMSQATGINCTGCHNSRNWAGWNDSSPQRVNAFYGIRMARSVNADYIEPLTPVFPPNRLGPNGDPWKVNCATCHNGQNKPLNGVSMLPDHPGLGQIYATPVDTAAVEPAPPAGTPAPMPPQ